MPSQVYTISKFLLAEGSLGWVDPSITFRAMLMVPAYTYNPAHQSVSDIVASEVSDPTYSRIDVTGRVASVDYPNDRGVMDTNNLVFINLENIVTNAAVIYRQGGGNDLSPDDDILFAYLSFPSQGATGINFLVTIDPDGLAALTVC